MKTFSLKKHHKTNHFEGFYVRVISDDYTHNYAFIFAVSTYEADPHAFLQIFDGIANTNQYYRYDVSDFTMEEGALFLGENRLSLNKLHIETDDFYGEFAIKSREVNQKSAMGFLRFFPLECYQEVIFLNASIEGNVRVDGKKVPIKGKSYMEKTYGKNFPTQWYWIQANQFKNPDVFLSTSGGDVPLLGRRIFGFFAILKFQNKTYRFSSYKLSKIKMMQKNDTIILKFKSFRHTLEITTQLIKPTMLKGPSKYGKMDLDVSECLRNVVNITLLKGNRIIHQDTSEHTGVEWMIKYLKE